MSALCPAWHPAVLPLRDRAAHQEQSSLTEWRNPALGDPSSEEQKLYNYMDIEVMKQWTAASGSTQSQKQHEQLLGQVPFLAQSICWGKALYKALYYLQLFFFLY